MRRLLYSLILLFAAGCATHNYLPFKYETYTEDLHRVYDSICASYYITPYNIDEWESFEIYTPSNNKMLRTSYWVGKSDSVDNKFIFTLESPDSVLNLRIEK